MCGPGKGPFRRAVGLAAQAFVVGLQVTQPALKGLPPRTNRAAAALDSRATRTAKRSPV
jgi:hypothetical protein